MTVFIAHLLRSIGIAPDRSLCAGCQADVGPGRKGRLCPSCHAQGAPIGEHALAKSDKAQAPPATLSLASLWPCVLRRARKVLAPRTNCWRATLPNNDVLVCTGPTKSEARANLKEVLGGPIPPGTKLAKE